MVKRRILDPLPFFDEDAVFELFRERGWKELHYYTIAKVIIQSRPKRIRDVVVPSAADPRKHCLLLPTGMIEALDEKFAICTSRVIETYVSKHDGTVKLLIELQDGSKVESVIIKHQGRNTLCVSSQVGCQMACTFCATGTMGLTGNLMGGEIAEQLYHANTIAPIRNVVYMGEGEPLQNYDAVMCSFRAITDIRRFGLSHHQVTISTVGVIPRIRQLTKDAPFISVALSLHAPNQDLRLKIVPSAKAFKIDRLLEACWDHIKVSKKPLFVEYIVLKMVNDRPEHAHELGQLLSGRDCVVNLIPYNPTEVTMEFEIPDDADVDAFFQILVSEYKILCTIRRHHGRDIGGACGQLALKHVENSAKGAPALNDIEDLMSGKKGCASGGGRGGGAAVSSGKVVKNASNNKKTNTQAKKENVVGMDTEKNDDDDDNKVAEKEEDALTWKKIPDFVSCSGTTWLLTLSGAAVVALVVGLTVARIGITAYSLKDPHSSRQH